MEGLEVELNFLLEGKSIDEGPVDITGNESFVPITKRSVGYIVCGVVINDDDEVLMMQEAKPSRAGTWYLPAGRLEPNETLEDGVKREVLEETGLYFEPTTLLCVEVARGQWFRFTFTGTITGGTLKTLDDEDNESMQGRWCPVADVRPDNSDLPLRATDILALIETTVNYKKADPKPHSILPVMNPHKKLLLRSVFIGHDGDSVHILFGKKGCPHFPQIALSPGMMSIQVPIFSLLHDIYTSVVELLPNIHGILSAEYNGTPAKEHDGVCITILVSINNKEGKLPTVDNNEDYEWHLISNEELSKAVVDRKDMCIPLIDI